MTALIEAGPGRWVEPAPARCPAGHRVMPGRILVGWDGSKRVYRCLQCEEP